MAHKLFSVLLLMALLIASSAMTNWSSDDDSLSDYRRSTSRLLAAYDPRASITCERFPRVCRAKGSPGPDCCRKQCVNVMTDELNCGECGKRCRYGEACCKGTCVNVMYDPDNCGGCKNKCSKGSFCKYGMCSYA